MGNVSDYISRRMRWTLTLGETEMRYSGTLVRNQPVGASVHCTNLVGSYFSSRRLGSLGVFQDGGLTLNNPTSVAVQEVASLFPGARKPGVVGSFGTGFAPHSAEENTAKRSWWAATFASRICKAFWRQGKSDVAWKQLMGVLREKNEKPTAYFRFDMQFDGKGPELDDVDKMDLFGQAAYKATANSSETDRLVSLLRAQLFIFEVDTRRTLRYSHGFYTCSGSITCRLQGGSPQLEAFTKQLRDVRALFRVPHQSVECDLREEDGMYSQRVEFQVRSLQEEFEITFAENDSEASICGSPFTLSWLNERQKLNEGFGNEFHRKRKHSILCDDEFKQSKRQKMTSQGHFRSSRRRS